MFQLVDVLGRKDFVIDLLLYKILLEDNRYYMGLCPIPHKESRTP
jgi:hypothetical protein